MMVAGIVLAAGEGSRLGGPKALLHDVDGRSWAALAAQTLIDAGCDPVLVTVGAAGAEVTGTLCAGVQGDRVDVRAVPVPGWQEGMGASLRAALDALDLERCDAALVTLVDLPDVRSDVVSRVLRRAAETAAAGEDGLRLVLARAVFAGRPGHPVLIGRGWWPEVRSSAVGDVGARALLARPGVLEVECGDLATGADVDLPGGAARAAGRAGPLPAPDSLA